MNWNTPDAAYIGPSLSNHGSEHCFELAISSYYRVQDWYDRLVEETRALLQSLDMPDSMPIKRFDTVAESDRPIIRPEERPHTLLGMPGYIGTLVRHAPVRMTARNKLPRGVAIDAMPEMTRDHKRKFTAADLRGHTLWQRRNNELRSAGKASRCGTFRAGTSGEYAGSGTPAWHILRISFSLGAPHRLTFMPKATHDCQ